MPDKKSFHSASALTFITLLFFGFTNQANADILYLKNGRNIEGIIKSEDEKKIQLDIGGGTIGLLKSEIRGIYKASPQEILEIRQGFQHQLQESKERRYDRKPQGSEKKSIEVSTKLGHIVVSALLNKRANVSLMLDTGASLIVLTKEAGRKLGIRSDDKKDMVQMQMADGKMASAQYVVLETVNVQGVEANNVGAAVLLEDAKNAGFGDGLLGMSFLNNFNFRIDQEKKQLTLEKFKKSLPQEQQ